MGKANSAAKSEENRLTEDDSFCVTKKRWLVLFVISAAVFVDIYSVSVFSYTNDLVSAYFYVTPAVTDLLSTLNQTARGIVSLMVAVFCEYLHFRRLTLIATTFVPTGCLMLAIGISFRSTFAITVIGQMVNGAASAALVLLPAITSRIWFPENERAISFSIPWATRRLSMSVSSILSTYTFSEHKELPENISIATENVTEKDIDISTLSGFRFSYQIIFYSLAIFALITNLVAQIIITDGPNVSRSRSGGSGTEGNLRDQPKAIWNLLKQKNFLIIAFNFMLLMSVRPILNVLLSSMVLKRFPALNDKTPATMYCIAYLAGALGGPSAGFLLDRYKKFKVITVVGMVFVSLACGFFTLSFYFYSVPAVYVSLALLVYAREFAFTSLSNILYERTVYTNKLRIVSLFMAFPLITVFVYVRAIRYILDNAGVLLAAGFPIPFLCLGALTSVFL